MIVVTVLTVVTIVTVVIVVIVAIVVTVVTVTNPKKTFFFLHFFNNKKIAPKNSNSIVIKLKNSNCDETQKHKI